MNSQTTFLLVIGLTIVMLCMNNNNPNENMDGSSNTLLLLGGVVIFICIMSQNNIQPFSNIIGNTESYHCIPKSQNFVGTNKSGLKLSDVGDCTDPDTDITPLASIQPQRNVLDVSMTKDNVPNKNKLNYNNISNYDGLCITTGNNIPWRDSPTNIKLLDDHDLYTTMGYDTSLYPVKSDPSSLSGPPINGFDGPNKLFMLSNNQSSPYCNSIFSTSTGQLCLTDNQLQYVAGRGGNQDINSNF
jgi:hypothetical protein